MNSPLTLFDKIWNSHVVRPESPSTPAILHVDLHLVHEVTSPQAFNELRQRSLCVRRPDLTLATLDHSTPTLPPDENGNRSYVSVEAEAQVGQLEKNAREFGITLHGWESRSRGIVHVLGPELGATQPGMVIVCGDSHTSTHGAFGALAFGIGTTEVTHVLATQCLLQRKPGTMAVHVDGRLREGVSAKDLILYIIGRIGVDGGTGHVIEYRGSAIEALSMEERMTVCNMSIEAGARAGLIAPDSTTFDWLRGREQAPSGEEWDRCVARWSALRSDEGAVYDKEVHVNALDVVPTITWGTHPGTAIGITSAVPASTVAADQQALRYMALEPGQSMLGLPVDVVFVGSCTNGRLSDLREVAAVLRGRRVKPGVRMLIVPGSEQVRLSAETEGLDQVFRSAGAEWRLPGCSMCIAMNGDAATEGQLVVTTSNRNFEGRQGKGVRTVLASPATAAASAVEGVIADPRALKRQEQTA